MRGRGRVLGKDKNGARSSVAARSRRLPMRRWLLLMEECACVRARVCAVQGAWRGRVGLTVWFSSQHPLPSRSSGGPRTIALHISHLASNPSPRNGALPPLPDGGAVDGGGRRRPPGRAPPPGRHGCAISGFHSLSKLILSNFFVAPPPRRARGKQGRRRRNPRGPSLPQCSKQPLPMRRRRRDPSLCSKHSQNTLYLLAPAPPSTFRRGGKGRQRRLPPRHRSPRSLPLRRARAPRLPFPRPPDASARLRRR